MSSYQNEATLTTRKLHWGIMVVPLLALAPFGLMALPIIFILHLMRNMFAQISPQAVSPFVGWIWLFLIFPAVMIVLPLLVVTWLAYCKSEITLTNQRLIYRTGMLARVSGELPLNNIEVIILTEPILGRLLGYGTVMVTTLGGLRLPFRYIGAATGFHSTLQAAVQAVKTRPTPQADSPLPKSNDDSRWMPKS